MIPTDLITERTAAEILGVTPSALQAWRYRSQGPTWIRVGPRAVRYRRSDIEAWIASRTVQTAGR